MSVEVAHGAAFDPEACEKLPIHIPGLIQPHGVLIVLRSSDLTVAQASTNLPKWFDSSVSDSLGQPIAKLIGQSDAARLADTLSREQLDNGPRFALTLPERESRPALDITVHRSGGQLVLEIEPSERSNRSLADPYNLVRDSIAQLQTCGELTTLCQTAADELRKITGFDRVMLYRFAEDSSGSVVAESKRADVISLLDKRFPAGDIPKPARALFAKNWLRLVPDIAYEPVALEPEINPETGLPLDMTFCLLRHSSNMCTTYLKNLGTASQMVMPLLNSGQLWGLLVCHHLTPRYVPFPVRAACEVFAQVTSLQISSMAEKEQLQARAGFTAKRERLLTACDAVESIPKWLFDTAEALADYIPCDGLAVSCGAQLRQIGLTPSETQTRSVIDWLNEQHQEIFSTDRLPQLCPSSSQFADVASGLLMMRLELNVPCMLIWFRQELPQTVTWAGDPRKPVETGPMGEYLSPRRSFERWVETVRGRSEPWTQDVFSAVDELRTAIVQRLQVRSEYSKRIEEVLDVDRKELDTFVYVASHDLQEPVRGIHGYANYLIDQASEKLSAEERRRLNGLIRLTDRMSSLIESLLHFSRVGRLDLTLGEYNLGHVAAEALEVVTPRATSSGVEIQILDLPTVRCDRAWIREVFVNLITNAIKYNDQSNKKIEIGARVVASENNAEIYVKDNGIGIEKKNYEQVFKLFKRLHGKEQYGGGTGAGLALAKKIIERHGGRIWIESTIGQGSTFIFTLPLGDVI